VEAEDTRDRQGINATSEIIYFSGGESRKKFVTKLIMQQIHPMMMKSKNLKILQGCGGKIHLMKQILLSKHSGAWGKGTFRENFVALQCIEHAECSECT
jgi:hypothetical protein